MPLHPVNQPTDLQRCLVRGANHDVYTGQSALSVFWPKALDLLQVPYLQKMLEGELRYKFAAFVVTDRLVSFIVQESQYSSGPDSECKE